MNFSFAFAFVIIFINISTNETKTMDSVKEFVVKDRFKKETSLCLNIIYRIYKSGVKSMVTLSAQNQYSSRFSTYFMTDLKDNTQELISIGDCDKCPGFAQPMCSEFNCLLKVKTIKFIRENQFTKVALDEYRLSSFVHKFTFETTPDALLHDHLKTVDLIQRSVFTNKSPAIVKQTLEKEEIKTQEIDLEFNHEIQQSMSSLMKTSVEMSHSSGNWFFFWNKQKTQKHREGESRNGESETKGEKFRFSNSTTKRYKISQTIEIPAFSAVVAQATYKWVDNMKTPFSAQMTVSGKCPENVGCDQLSGNQIKVLLFDSDFKGKYLKETYDSVTYLISGEMTATFGMDSVFHAEEINEPEDLEYDLSTPAQSPKTNSGLIWSVVVIISVLFLAIIVFKIYKGYTSGMYVVNDPNREPPIPLNALSVVLRSVIPKHT